MVLDYAAFWSEVPYFSPDMGWLPAVGKFCAERGATFGLLMHLSQVLRRSVASASAQSCLTPTIQNSSLTSLGTTSLGGGSSSPPLAWLWLLWPEPSY